MKAKSNRPCRCSQFFNRITNEIRYPWDKWQDRRMHIASYGKHFFCQVTSFLSVLRMRGHQIRRRLAYRICVYRGQLAVRFQYV